MRIGQTQSGARTQNGNTKTNTNTSNTNVHTDINTNTNTTATNTTSAAVPYFIHSTTSHYGNARSKCKVTEPACSKPFPGPIRVGWTGQQREKPAEAGRLQRCPLPEREWVSDAHRPASQPAPEPVQPRQTPDLRREVRNAGHFG